LQAAAKNTSKRILKVGTNNKLEKLFSNGCIYTPLFQAFTTILSVFQAQQHVGVPVAADKNLHFNWKLIMAPLPVIDYVVTHELAHLTELNHSRAFWERVRRMFPIYRQYRTWLKRHGG